MLTARLISPYDVQPLRTTPLSTPYFSSCFQRIGLEHYTTTLLHLLSIARDPTQWREAVPSLRVLYVHLPCCRSTCNKGLLLALPSTKRYFVHVPCACQSFCSPLVAGCSLDAEDHAAPANTDLFPVQYPVGDSG